jgi:hypothetical protein
MTPGAPGRVPLSTLSAELQRRIDDDRLTKEIVAAHARGDIAEEARLQRELIASRARATRAMNARADAERAREAFTVRHLNPFHRGGGEPRLPPVRK